MQRQGRKWWQLLFGGWSIFKVRIWPWKVEYYKVRKGE